MTPRLGMLPRAGFALLAALGVTLLILVAAGAPPLSTLTVMLDGGLGSQAALLRTLAAFTPLLLCGAALCVTFAANLWNIGVEGQITLGAICCQGYLRAADPGGGLPAALDLALGLGFGALGGLAWALLSGVLRTHGRVHEIFSGLGLNFVAMGASLWLILGPWKRPGMASMSGTETLPAELWLPTLGGRPMSTVGRRPMGSFNCASAAHCLPSVTWVGPALQDITTESPSSVERWRRAHTSVLGSTLMPIPCAIRMVS